MVLYGFIKIILQKKIDTYFIFSNLLYFKLLNHLFRLEIKKNILKIKDKKLTFCFTNIKVHFVKTPGILNSNRNYIIINSSFSQFFIEFMKFYK